MHDNAFLQLSLTLVLAAGVAVFMRIIRQPLILGYILAGLIVGPGVLHLVDENVTFEAFSEIGISLLLFIIGIGLNVSVIKKVGKPTFITAAASLVTIGTLGYLASLTLGYKSIEAIIIGLALFFSSTIIIVKVLNDKKEQNRLHGQIAIGIILLDDIVATFALLFVAASKDQSIGLAEIGLLLGKGALLFLLLSFISAKVFPKISRFMASSQEMLFLFAIAWGFGIASLFEFAGFSIEVGSLFAGVALATLPYAQEIEARLKPLRDFFVVLFFIVLGSSLQIKGLADALLPALALALLVIVMKPLVVITTLGLLGYPKRVSFKAGINLSQISEFSIVLVVLAASTELVGKELAAVITLVAIITIASSTYLIQYDNQLFAWFDRFKIAFLENTKHPEKRPTIKYPLILFGYHKGGHEFVRTFKDMKQRYVVVDYDPAVIESLQHQHVPCVYGDATDIELLEELGIKNAKLVISTMTDFETNQQLVRHINLYNENAVVICNANNYDEALQLYELGSAYVMIPHYIGSERLGTFIRKKGLSRDEFRRYREKHLAYLEANSPISLAEEGV